MNWKNVDMLVHFGIGLFLTAFGSLLLTILVILIYKVASSDCIEPRKPDMRIIELENKLDALYRVVGESKH